MWQRILAAVVLPLLIFQGAAGEGDPDLAQQFLNAGMPESGAYKILTELTGIGSRFAGSKGAAEAVEWGKKTMQAMGLENVHLEPVTVPHWVRGDREAARAVTGGQAVALAVTALGGSPATPGDGVSAEVVEVHSLDEVKQLGDAVRGKIVFYNRPMNPAELNTFEGYRGAQDQRTRGPEAASRAGAVAVLVRSLTMAHNDLPHTGGMKFEDPSLKIPAAALGILSAEKLSGLLRKDPKLKVTLELSGRMMEDVTSANVIGEIRGTEKPGEVVLIGAHLDSWDKGVGAHDDASGCSHVLEAMSLIRKLGLKPKRTIRAVLFMNEEFGLSGGKAYAAVSRPGEKHVVAIESDEGGFSPRGFSVEAEGQILDRIMSLSPRFQAVGATTFTKGEGGSDISVLKDQGVPCIGLDPDTQRYFDYHHSDADTLDKVHPRELELGAVSIATLSMILADEDLPVR